MIEADIPDKNIFMVCNHVNISALSEMPQGYTIRACRRDELTTWKAFPFDNPAEVVEYEPFMTDYFQTTYGAQEDLFFSKTLFVCDTQNRPVATCLLWKAYGAFNTIQWFKVLKTHEGKGIGRALLSFILRDLNGADYPVYLHTQPSSFRAIKLYTDFGFALLEGDKFGNRQNDLSECLPILRQFMPLKDFNNLKFAQPSPDFLSILDGQNSVQF
jgi:ribosomal protein S18 acetylase RimI-like enzyme